MSGGEEAAPRRGRAPLRQRSRRRWAVAGGVAAGWLVLEVIGFGGLRHAGAGGRRCTRRREPGRPARPGRLQGSSWIQRMASRPWRDGQDVLRVAMRHLPDVFVVTPSGSLLAPGVVELQLNPADLHSLRERMELGVISSSLTEVYDEQVAAYHARLAFPAGPRCTSSPAIRSRRGATGCGRAIRFGPEPGPTCSMSRMRTPCPNSRTPASRVPTPGPSATSGRTRAPGRGPAGRGPVRRGRDDHCA